MSFVNLTENRGCCENGCKNKYYGMNRFSVLVSVPQCRKHYRMFVLGWSEYEARRGRRRDE